MKKDKKQIEENPHHPYGCQCHSCIAIRKRYIEAGLWAKNYSARELGVEDAKTSQTTKV